MIGKIFLFIALVFFLLVLGGLFVVKGIIVEMQEQGIPVDELGQLFSGQESFQENLEGQYNPYSDYPDYADGQIDSPDTVDSSKITTKEATQAYQDYIEAYNKLTELMSAGKGDTPEAQQAYQEYKEAKEIYEQIAKELK